MQIENVISLIQATGATLDSLITQVAYFFAIKAAAGWFSITLPLLILYGVLSRIAKTLKDEGASAEKRGSYRLVAWVLFSICVYTGVQGLAPVLQAAMAPSIYVASEIGGLDEVIKTAFTKK